MEWKPQKLNDASYKTGRRNAERCYDTSCELLRDSSDMLLAHSVNVYQEYPAYKAGIISNARDFQPTQPDDFQTDDKQ